MPKFLSEKVKQSKYEKWLHRKASAHYQRDRRRGTENISREIYKIAIHKAVEKSFGKDTYTGEDLRWDLLCKYENEKSKAGRSYYKERFALLPSVDHVDFRKKPDDFIICSWRTNDAKNDLNKEDFFELCKKVL